MILLSEPTVIVEGLNLPECPRWHDGALTFSDITAGRIYRLGMNDQAEIVHEEPDDFVGGLGFLANGDLLAVLSKQRKLLRIGPQGATEYADLTGLCRFVLNDMVVHGGRAYVSQPGFDIWTNEAHGMPDPTDIILVQPDGATKIAASDMMSPNGMAISPDGRTLYVAESTAMRITCFDIDPDSGALSNRRLFGALPQGGIPDGICLDNHGAVWSASPVAYSDGVVHSGLGVIRIAPSGDVTHCVSLAKGRRALACAIGGTNGGTLYICTVPEFEGPAAFSAAEGRLEKVSLANMGSL
ncbi:MULTISPECIES: SMP-30/gluconolactonase/LRE family protein [Sphingobium]|jgi:sugar lactone lactonase YvrE|uniref:SMP-30/gluconolactonase/LRE family protein n=1 Tax=Sphingobium tyrosinilyticum TaxID=2715436 RepID=A0ABV9F008_9SPHN|nr:SMP-30/gluconolactonase/LRE family protein [Sphingobium sp. EP60837]ANI76981.1 Gluconolactonase [Sphingobium sp. EP60837]